MPDVLSLSAFVEFARGAGMAVLATASPAGRPEAALLGVAVTDSGELVVDIVGTARKLANIDRNDQAALVIGWDDVSMQVEGRIRLVCGDERRTYERVYLEQFPGSRVADPAFAVAVITPTWMRRYDANAAWQSAIVRTGDARIAYTEAGAGPSVLLLHGSFAADWFAPVAKLLIEQGYRVLRPHRAGYGHSTGLTGDLDVSAHAAHAAAVLTASGVTSAHVVGHSSGATVAVELARTRTDLVESLVLLDAVAAEGERLGTPHRARSVQLAAGLPNAVEDPELVATTIDEFIRRSGG